MTILSPSEFHGIIDRLERWCKGNNAFECLELLRDNYAEISDNTLSSILHQFICKKNKQNCKKLGSYSKDIMHIYKKFIKSNDNGVFIHLSKKYKISPLNIAKHFLLGGDYSQGTIVNAQIKDPFIIDDPDLSREVFLAMLYDYSYGFIPTKLSHVLGREFEIKLERNLTAKGISFKSEHDLRALKYDRTPDILLEIPVAVDNHVVKWIESKALFANDECHLSLTESQYRHYTDSFGPGLVIYWHGHTSTIKCDKKKFIVYDRFPENIVTMDVCPLH